MHIVFIHSRSSFATLFEEQLIQMVEGYREKKCRCTLLYDPLLSSDPRFLDHFDAAFPLVDLKMQMPELDADYTVLCDWHEALPIPTLPWTPSLALSTFGGHTFEKRHFSGPISVIVRSKNSASTMAQVLKALFSQTVDVNEVIVVDSSSTDQTVEIAKQYPVRLTFVKADDYFPGKVLNKALEGAIGELIVFDNADAVMLTPRSLESLIAPFADPLVQGTFSRQIPRPDAKTWVRRDYEVAFPASTEAPGWMSLSLSLAAIKRKMWDRRPFYTEAWGSEDAEWGEAIKKKGFNIDYASESLVMHSHNYSLHGLYGRKFIEGEAEAFIFGRRYSFAHCLRDIFKSILRDVFYYLKRGDFLHLYEIPFVRTVYHWAYYRGHCYGMERIQRGFDDPSRGQKEVLSRYE